MGTLYFTLTFLIASLCFTINAESAGSSIVRSNLKRIINDALDALVNIEEDTSELTARAAEIAAGASEITSSNEADDESFLTNEIKELENLLMADKKEMEKGKVIEAFFDSAVDASAAENKRSENDFKSSFKKELLFDDVNNNDGNKEISNTKRESKSREEKASVELDNNNLEDLVEYVVRTIDQEAKRAEESSEEKNAVAKKEIEEVKKEEEKDAASKNEIVEEGTKKSNDKKELCNSRKKECVQKKSVNKELTLAKKTVNSDDGMTKDGDDSDDIREMVGKILDGKREEEREMFANLLEDILEKSKGNSVEKKNKE